MLKEVYLGEVLLQKDGRVKLPEQAVLNLGLDSTSKKTYLRIFLDTSSEDIIIRRSAMSTRKDAEEA